MPTGYSYNLGSPGGAGVGKKTKYYDFTLRFDPATRELIMRDSEVDEGDPDLELVLMTLATPLGSYRPDSTLGLDYEILRKLRTDTRQRWKDAVLKSLVRFSPARITNLVVEVDPPIRSRLLYSVAFTSVRSAERIGPVALAASV